ncbi:MAG: CGNR zinc finger domain-containing protein [Nocardiopsaceae bacterium]|jgi:predicted RNA-binding Zn ribbon-like protein|nr:CGNR zinc finger domain-containing protein [Nocardiopsaceae bacterium]
MAPEQDKPAHQAVAAPAPGRLELVRAFVNTLDIEAGTDEFSSPHALDSWLRERDLTEPAAPASPAAEADLRRAIAMREGFREVLLTHVPAHDGSPSGPPPSGLAELRAAAEGLVARLTIADDGTVRTTPAGQGAAYGLAELMLIAAEAATSGTWDRLKVCSADDCRWAFYDRSPTRSGCWCSMAVCGSRAKSRAFRRRAAGGRISRTARSEAASSAAS